MSTNRFENHAFPRIFKGRPLRTGHPGNRDALPPIRPYLRTIRFQGRIDRQQEKRTLPGATAAVSEFGYVAVNVIRIRIQEY
jgi:hypothetical protein